MVLINLYNIVIFTCQKPNKNANNGFKPAKYKIVGTIKNAIMLLLFAPSKIVERPIKVPIIDIKRPIKPVKAKTNTNRHNIVI